MPKGPVIAGATRATANWLPTSWRMVVYTIDDTFVRNRVNLEMVEPIGIEPMT